MSAVSRPSRSGRPLDILYRRAGLPHELADLIPDGWVPVIDGFRLTEKIVKHLLPSSPNPDLSAAILRHARLLRGVTRYWPARPKVSQARMASLACTAVRGRRHRRSPILRVSLFAFCWLSHAFHVAPRVRRLHRRGLPLRAVRCPADIEGMAMGDIETVAQQICRGGGQRPLRRARVSQVASRGPT